MPKELLTTGDVAAMFGTSRETVRQWAEDGKVLSFRTPGGHLRFRRADIAALLPAEPASDGAA